MLPREIIKYQDKLYWVYRKIKNEHIVDGKVQDVKEFFGCDMVVKHRNNEDELLLFLREISDIEFELIN